MDHMDWFDPEGIQASEVRHIVHYIIFERPLAHAPVGDPCDQQGHEDWRAGTPPQRWPQAMVHRKLLEAGLQVPTCRCAYCW